MTPKVGVGPLSGYHLGYPDLTTEVNSFDDLNKNRHFLLKKRQRTLLKLVTHYTLLKLVIHYTLLKLVTHYTLLKLVTTIHYLS